MQQRYIYTAFSCLITAAAAYGQGVDRDMSLYNRILACMGYQHQKNIAYAIANREGPGVSAIAYARRMTWKQYGIETFTLEDPNVATLQKAYQQQLHDFHISSPEQEYAKLNCDDLLSQHPFPHPDRAYICNAVNEVYADYILHAIRKTPTSVSTSCDSNSSMHLAHAIRNKLEHQRLWYDARKHRLREEPPHPPMLPII